MIIASRGPEVIVKPGGERYALRFGRGDLTSPTRALRTLAHRAVHVVAHHHHGQDNTTSRQGRYHNTAFLNLAGRLGLPVKPETGEVSLTGNYRAWFNAYAPALRRPLDIYRANAPGPAPRGEGWIKAVCRCTIPKIGRFAQSTLDRGKGIKCGDCNQPFTPAT